MNEKTVAHGVLFYASLYANGILLITGITTGRWVFMLLILLNIGLTAYMMYIISSNSEHLSLMGVWAEEKITLQLEKLKRLM